MKAAKESEELKRFIAESKKETERMISLRRRVPLQFHWVCQISKLFQEDEDGKENTVA